MELSKLEKVQFYVTLIEMLIAIIVVIGFLIKICQDFRYKFIVTLCVLILICNIGTAVLDVAVTLEYTNVHAEKPEMIGWLVGTSTLLYIAG